MKSKTVLSRLLLSAALGVPCVVGATGGVEAPNHPIDPIEHADVVNALNSGHGHLHDIRRIGMEVFTTPFNTLDGMGDGPFDNSETDTLAFGQRPTLQGNGLNLRINGLDAQSCNECHTIVSSTARPPALGIGGVGGMVQNAIIMPTMIDVADSSDDRTQYEPGHSPDLALQFEGVVESQVRKKELNLQMEAESRVREVLQQEAAEMQTIKERFVRQSEHEIHQKHQLFSLPQSN